MRLRGISWKDPLAQFLLTKPAEIVQEAGQVWEVPQQALKEYSMSKVQELKCGLQVLHYLTAAWIVTHACTKGMDCFGVHLHNFLDVFQIKY